MFSILVETGKYSKESDEERFKELNKVKKVAQLVKNFDEAVDFILENQK